MDSNLKLTVSLAANSKRRSGRGEAALGGFMSAEWLLIHNSENVEANLLTKRLNNYILANVKNN